QVQNILAHCKFLANTPGEVDWLAICLECFATFLEVSDNVKLKLRVAFLLEQLQLFRTPPNRWRFSTELLMFSFTLHSYSSRAYNHLRRQGALVLPSEKVLGKITRNIGESPSGTDRYLKMRYSKLAGMEENVVLIIDEVYIAKRIEYSSAQGKLYGMTADSTIAGTMLCFMVQSICSKYKDIVAMYPTSKISSQKVNGAYSEVLLRLSTIGFNVIAISVDNHSSNRKFFVDHLCGGELQPSTTNPHTGQPIFLIFDPVHNLNNIYNNFQSRKDFVFPDFGNPGAYITASFKHIEELYGLESSKPIKLAHKLSLKALDPKSIEKCSTKLAFSVFHESTRDALKFYSENCGHQEWSGTVQFLSLILKLWNIVNVSSASMGMKKRD
ncbi:MAG: hypothetical protein GY821_11480, partial [Gammaproteobacteria bacterium]|nr:hypothetical protein [Gammaproteobacteria bacterium]